MDIKSLIAFKKVGNKSQNHHLYGIDKGMHWEKPIGDKHYPNKDVLKLTYLTYSK